MPPPSSQRGDIEPPPQVTNEAVKGFLTGAVRYGSLSILAHLILILPHPMSFASSSTPSTQTSQSPYPSQSSPRPRRPFSASLTSLFHRPLTSLSKSLAPSSKVYRGLTPQFKVFLQIAVMTLGGCIWAEQRVTEYSDAVRRVKRAERRREEFESGVRVR